ncbi:toxin [Streptomyces olivoreticuli]
MRDAVKGLPAGHARRNQLRRLRKAGARRIAELELPALADVTSLCSHLSAVRDRPITLVPMQMQATLPCGMWVSARVEDLIFYDANTSSAHQEHIILHELGHIICCHRGSGQLDEVSARVLFPNLSPTLVRDMLMRATYDDIQEQEAEVIAYLLSQRIGRTEERSGAASSEEEVVICRVERTLF